MGRTSDVVTKLSPRNGRLRLITPEDLDRRTRGYKLYKDRAERLLTEATPEGQNPAAVHRELAESAALLGALVRDAAAHHLRGDRIDTTSALVIVNTQRRLLADLGKPARAALAPDEIDDWSELLTSEAASDD